MIKFKKGTVLKDHSEMKIEDIKPRGGLIQDRKPTGLVKDIKAKMIKVNSSELGLQTTNTTYNDSATIYSSSSQVYGGIYGKYGEPPKMKGVTDL